MKILNTSFSDKGLKEFEKLTRKEQKELIKAKNPLSLPNEIERALKRLKYGKSKRNKPKVKKSDTTEVAEQGKGVDNKRPNHNRSETE